MRTTGAIELTTPITECRIWGYPAEGYSVPDPSKVVVTESHRAGGGYVAPGSVSRRLTDLSDDEKARLTSWLIDQRLQGSERPIITPEVLDYATGRDRLPIHERADRLLRYMVIETNEAGDAVDTFASTETPEIQHYPDIQNAMAWSESTSPNEVSYLLRYLEEEGMIQSAEATVGETAMFFDSYIVTVAGHSRVADQQAKIVSSQAFVAMWFDDSVTSAYEQGIVPAIRASGFEPMRIDRNPSVDKIDDAIIAEIRRSRFLIADFTHGEDGARGGVYYEAGFAHGLGIPVIFTCRKDQIDKLHFDTRQYAHIVWDSPEELRTLLRDRILARIGEGPNATL